MKRNKKIIIFVSFFKKNKKGFTLIEILVTIVIISLLAGIVSINLSSARGKAAIAKSLEFNQTVNNVIGAYAVGAWIFNEGAGNSVKDNSSYNNSGAWSGSAGWVPNSITQLGFAGQFDSSYVDIGDPASGILDFGTSDFSISAWFYLPSLPGTWKSIIAKGASTGNALGYGMEISNDNRITCSIRGNGGSNQRVSGSVPKAGVWHYGVCVFDRNNMVIVYLDGKESASESIAGNAGSLDNTYSFRIGAHSGNGNSATQRFSGQIDEVRVFTSTLMVKEIQKNYAEREKRYKNFTER